MHELSSGIQVSLTLIILVGMLSTSFATEYRGPGAAALLARLKQEEKNFSSNHPRPYYARFFCFIQASGTGKTRTIMQVSPSFSPVPET